MIGIHQVKLNWNAVEEGNKTKCQRKCKWTWKNERGSHFANDD